MEPRFMTDIVCVRLCRMVGKIEIVALVLLSGLAASLFFFPVNDGGMTPLRDIDGILHGSLGKPLTNLTVLLFLATSCPISTQYALEIISICDEYRTKGAECFLVYPE